MPKKRTNLPEVYTVEELAEIEFIPSTVDAVTQAVGGSGIPQKGVVEIYGRESGGKSTIALTFVPDLYIDLEHALDPVWAKKFVPGMPVAQPDTLESAFGLVEHTLAGGPRLIVLDSLGGGLSEREVDSNQQAAQAGATSRWLRMLVPQLDNTCLLIVNQLRSSFSQYGPPTTTPGGHVLKHLALMRVEVKIAAYHEVADKRVGQSILLRVTKSKVGVPWNEGEVHLSFGGKFYDSPEALKEGSRRRGAKRGSVPSSGEQPGGDPPPSGAGVDVAPSTGGEGAQRP